MDRRPKAPPEPGASPATRQDDAHNHDHGERQQPGGACRPRRLLVGAYPPAPGTGDYRQRNERHATAVHHVMVSRREHHTGRRQLAAHGSRKRRVISTRASSDPTTITTGSLALRGASPAAHGCRELSTATLGFQLALPVMPSPSSTWSMRDRPSLAPSTRSSCLRRAELDSADLMRQVPVILTEVPPPDRPLDGDIDS
jgi:hypothetical protein